MTAFDFSGYITDRTHDFVGREWVFDAIARWLDDLDGPRYFIITGEPGIGKTAIATRLTQVYDIAAHHFCTARQADTSDPLLFAQSISQQLGAIDGFAEGILEQDRITVDAQQTIHQNLRLTCCCTEGRTARVACIPCFSGRRTTSHR